MTSLDQLRILFLHVDLDFPGHLGVQRLRGQ